MESVCMVFCVCLVHYTALSKSIHFIALISGLLRVFLSVCVSPLFNELYGLLTTSYGIYIVGFYTPYIIRVYPRASKIRFIKTL